MANKDKNGNWVDSKGNIVPPKYVKPIDRKRDQVAESIANDAQKLRESMQKVKERAMKRLMDYDAWLAKELDVEVSKKGNIQITNFSSTVQIEYKIADVIEFDDTLRHAKELIDQCMLRWVANGHENVKVLITRAFNVDKKGRINTRAILDLRTINIKDDQWKKAMDLINDSIKPSGTRQYLRVRVREVPEAAWQNIDLNWSTL